MTYRVGPGSDCDYPGPFDLIEANVLRAGDVVEITTGKLWKVAQKYLYPAKDAGSTVPITWRGISDAAGNRPVFDGRDKMLESPRAFFELYGTEQGEGAGDGAWIIENLEFQYAKNNDADMNGAGIRNVNAASVIIKNCKIWNCAAGVMSSDQSGETVIEDCDIGFVGYGDGHSHCIYCMGKKFRLLHSRIHDSTMGQNVKTRSVFVEIAYNQIFSSGDGEIGIIQAGDGSPAGAAATSEPGSNAIVVDNEIITRKDRGDGNKTAVVVFGKDMGTTGRNGTLYLHGNKVICNNAENNAIKLTGGTTRLDARHNKFIGVTNSIVWESDPALSVTGAWNWIPPDAALPAGFEDTPLYEFTMGEAPYAETAPGNRRVRNSLLTPGNVRDYPEEGQWAIAWDAVPNALYYRIWRYNRENGKGTTKNRVWGGSTQPWHVDVFQHYASEPNRKREYVYQVQAVDHNLSQSALSVKWCKEAGQPGFVLPPSEDQESEVEI